MGRLACVAACLAGACGYQHGHVPGGDADTTGDDAGDDAAGGDDAGMMDGMADGTLAPLCNASSATLRACYTFESSLLDLSGKNNNITASNNAVFVAGHSGLGLLTTSGTFTVQPTTTLDVSALSIRIWINPNTIPTGGTRMGLVDSPSRWRLFLQSDGALRCALTGGADLTTGTGKVVANAWQRVTCTYDGAQMAIYVDGSLVGSLTAGSTFPMPGTGMVVGHNNPNSENFIGTIDDLQIFGAVVTP